MSPAGGTLVVGLGNRFRGDDAAGLLAADRLRALAPAGVSVLAHEGNPLDLLDRLAGVATLVVIDAAASEGPTGSIRQFDPCTDDVWAAEPGISGHGFGLRELLELARLSGTLPATVRVVAIEGARFGLGDDRSPEVEGAVGEAVALVEALLAPTPTPTL